jgi:predicted MarR family transcription regulator
LVLHQIGGGADGKGVADLSFVLNIEDVHVVSYSLRKLVGLGIVKACRRGKEVTYSVTPLGREYLQLYRQIREECLMRSIDVLQINPVALKELAQYLRKLSGLYDQAARAASSF